MMASRSYKFDPELYQKVKSAVSITQAAEFCGLQIVRGQCLCPFHADHKPSMKIYPNGKGFYCFVCGAGGDQIKLVAGFLGCSNYEAAKQLAKAYNVPIAEPMTYSEKRKAERAAKERQKRRKWQKHALAMLKMYRILLCEERDPQKPRFWERIANLDRVDYLVERVENEPETAIKDREAMRKIGEVERRVIDWYKEPGER